MNEFLLIIPAYNEEENISKVLESIMQLHLPIDILVINDGSSDQTLPLAKQHPISIRSHPINLGYGCTIQTGYRYATEKKYPYVIIFDADGQHDSAYLSKMMDAIKVDSNDVVIGSRFLMKSSINIGILKKCALRLFRILIFLITRKKITDPTSGFQGLKYRVYHTLAFSKSFPHDFPDSNFIIEAILNKHNIIEIPVNMFDRKHGKSMHYGINLFIYMLQSMLSIVVVFFRHKCQAKKVKSYE